MRDNTIMEISKTIKEFYDKLPKFTDGRIDYHTSDIAPVITVFVESEGKILLLKRGDKVSAYHGKWNAIAGYLDEVGPLENKVLEELREEIGVTNENISEIYYGKIHRITDKKIGKTWIIQPVLVKLEKKPKINLDWEHTDYKWILPSDMENFELVYKLKETYKNLMDGLK